MFNSSLKVSQQIENRIETEELAVFLNWSSEKGLFIFILSAEKLLSCLLHLDVITVQGK